MFSLPAAVAAIIEDARRRQHRRRRTIAVVTLGLAVIAGAGFFGSRQFGAHRHTATSAQTVTSASFTYVTESGPYGVTLRRAMPIPDGLQGKASMWVVLDPQTGAIEVRTFRGGRAR